MSKYIKKQTLHERLVKDTSFVLNADGSIELNPASGKQVTVNGNLNVTGNSPGATSELIYYVSTEGNDTNSGKGAGPGQAKKSVKAAVEAAPAGATIQVAAGDYYENNPITLKERQTVRGDSLRNTQIYPNNDTETIFYMDNACYLFQITMRALRDPGWCAEIKPGALVTVSPYVQNCTNMNGPWLNDGTEFIPFKTVQIEGVTPGARPIENDPNVPLAKRVNVNGGGNGMKVDGAQYNQNSLVKSFVADAFTQIAQGGIGFLITNEGYTQIVSCFSVFTRVGFQATAGGYLSISNSVSDFGTFAIIADGLSQDIFTTARPTQDYFSTVGSVTINSDGSGYTNAPTVTFDPPLGDPNGVIATGAATIDATTGVISAITINNPGSGYDRAPTVTLTGGGFDTIATATANLVTNRIIEVSGLRDIPQTGSIIKFEGDATGYYVTENDITQQPFIYNETVCRRDVRRIVDAVVGDLVMGTNYQSLAAGRSYLRATSSKVLNAQLAPTVYGIEAARDEMLARLPDGDPANEDARYFIIERFAEITAYLNLGDSTASPDVDFGNLSTVDEGKKAAKDALVLNRDFIVQELTKYISEQFTNVSYNQSKCESDTKKVVEAIAYDVATGSNYRTITAALAYARASAKEVTDQQFTVSKATFENTRDSIKALSDVAASSTALTRVTNLFAEYLDIFTGLNYNKDKCERDIGVIVDSVAWDIILNTNYNAVNTGQSYKRANSSYLISNQFQQTIAAYQYMRDLAASDYLDISSTAITRSNAAFNEILDIIENADSALDEAAVDTITWSDPGVDTNRRYARELLQLNRDFIATELTSWIATNYPSLDYDEAKCERDVKLITDAICFDIQYTGNFASRRAADSYFEGTVSQLGSAAEITATSAAYNQLINIYQGIALETYPGQQNTTNPASSTEVDDIGSLVQIIIDVIDDSSVDNIPAVIEPSISHISDANLIFAFNKWQDNKPAIQVDVLEEIDINITNADTLDYPTPSGANTNRVAAKNQLVANKNFIQKEISAYVNVNYPNVYNSGNGYNVKKCERDVGYIVDALAYDVLYGGNSASIIAAEAYFEGTVNQLGDNAAEVTATIAAYERLKQVASQIVLEGAVSRATGNNEVQDTSGTPATGTESTIVQQNVQIIIDVLEDASLDNLPEQELPLTNFANQDIQDATTQIYGQRTNLANETTTYILANYPNFTYDQTKCKRDVGLVLDAVVRDTQLGTNHNTITAAKAYKRATASYFNLNQNPATIMALRFVQGEVKTLVAGDTTATTRVENLFDIFFNIVQFDADPSEGTEFPTPTPASQERIDAARLLQDNKDFLIEETVLHINNQYFIYDSAKCSRDSGLILEGVCKDIVLGTNYWSVLNGLSYRRANSAVVIDDQLTETIGGITRLKSQAGNIITSDATALALLNSGFDEVIDIIQNGTSAADTITFSSNSPGRLGRIQIQNNKTLIEDEVILWIRDNEPELAASYNEATCRRDLQYVIDAISHDLNYNTNLATKEAAKAYFVGTTSQLPANQRTATGNAFEQMGAIVYDILLEAYSGQDVTGDIADSEVANKGTELAEIVADCVRANTLEILPADQEIDVSWTPTNLQTARTNILADKASLQADVVNYINSTYNGFSYSETKCRRDTGYIIDAVTHDLLYRGNRATLDSARSYYDDGASQVYGQEAQTGDALEHLRDVSISVVQGAAVVKETGNPEDQSISGSFASSAESEELAEYYDIIITAITDSDGLATTPQNSDPDVSWIEVGLSEAISKIVDATETIKTDTIDYITSDIVSFDYNIDKCERDTSYILDATIYDMMYGGNKQSRRAGEAYYSNAVIVGQETITELSYRRLAEVVELVAQNSKVTTSSGVTVEQQYSEIGGSATAGAYANTMIQKIADVIQFGNVSYLPTEEDHDYDNLGPTTLVKQQREDVLDDLDAIEDEAIRLLNAEYGGIAELTLFPGVVAVTEGTLSSMQRVSTVSTSGHAFEYVGAGVTYNALPFFGGSPIAENEFVETNNGKVFAGGTVDQIGNFKVGNFFNVNALTGAISLNAEEISLNGIASIGPFKRFGIPVGVELKEVSNSNDLVASTGSADAFTVPTQTAVKTYVENRYLNKLTGGIVEGDVQFETDIAVDGGDLTTTATVFNLINDNASSVNFAGGATSIVIGADTVGLTDIRHDANIVGTLDVGGATTIVGDFDLTIPDETQQAFNVSMQTEDYISIDTRNGIEKITFGDVPRIEILNPTESSTKSDGSLVVAGGIGIGKNLNVGGDIFFEGSIVSTDSASLSLFNDTAGTIEAFGDATEISFGSAGIVPGNFTVENDYIRYTSVYNMKVPTGTTGERGKIDDYDEKGYIRFNTDLGQFEGYDGIAWNSLGGVRDVDGNTYILAESSPGANENELSFVTDGLERMNLSNTAFRLDDTVTSITFEGTTESNSPDSGLLVIEGGMGIEKNLNVRGDLRVYNDTLLNGNLDVDGSLTIGTTDSVVDTLTVNANSTFNVYDATTGAFEVLEGSNSYFKLNTTDGTEEALFGTNPIVKIQNTTESTSATTGALVVSGGVGIDGNVFVTGNMTVDGTLTFGDDATLDSITVAGDAEFNIPDNTEKSFTVRQASIDYFNVKTTNSSEEVSFGSTPFVSIANNSEATAPTEGALQVVGGIGLEKSLFSGLDITAQRNIIAENNLEVNGTSISTRVDSGTFFVLNENIQTIEAFGAADTITIGASSGTVTFNNEVFIFDSTASVQLPVGSTAQRTAAVTGQIRFNNEDTLFEGYDGTAWGSLGGVKDVDQDTFIRPETSPGADEDQLEFVTNSVERMLLTNTNLNIDSTIQVDIANTSTSYRFDTGALKIAGGLGVAENVFVQGFIGGDTTGTLQLTDLYTDKLLIKAGTIETPDDFKIVSNAPDSAADDIVYPVTLAHHSVSGTPVDGIGVGMKFEVETTNDNFETGAQIDTVVQDITGTQEDFDMVISTMSAGSVTEKLRISETTSTFTTNLQIDQDLFVTGILDAAGFRGSVFADDSTEIIDGINNKITVTDAEVGTLTLTTDLEVQYGGTGVSTFTTDGILYGNAADPVQVTEAAGTSDTSESFQVLTVVGGGDNTPVWTDTIDGGEF